MTSQMLINPKAGLLKGCLTASQVKERIVGLNLDPEITIAKGDAGIQKFIAKVKREKPDVVLIAGGDGTTATILKGLINTNVTFGLIPTGSMNNIAASLGLGEELEGYVDIINTGKVSKMDLGKVNGEIFIESIGVGLMAEIMDRVGEQDSKKEVLKVVAHSIAEVLTTSTLPVKIVAGDRRVEAETVWLTVTNTGRAAAAVVDGSSSVHDREFELIYCEPLSVTELPKYVLAFARNSHVSEKKFHRLRAGKMTISLPRGTTVHVDGVLRKMSRLNVEVVPGVIKVFTP